ncbi:hypothetical protein M5689_024914 [Euphorbia peplus]|nr:hypothetical protein M5689_024914 [Euphorbia peplus]
MGEDDDDDGLGRGGSGDAKIRLWLVWCAMLVLKLLLLGDGNEGGRKSVRKVEKKKRKDLSLSGGVMGVRMMMIQGRDGDICG